MSRTAPISVVIPAHDEAAVLGACLRSIAEAAHHLDAPPEVVVVANHCTDDTAEVAASFDGVEVVVDPVPGKMHALNAGDARATAFPRVYLDADTVVSPTALRELVEIFREPSVLAAAPRMVIATDPRASRVVQRFLRAWARSPYVGDGLLGAGCYALSRAGHERVGRFHAAFTDDIHVDHVMGIGDRRTTCTATFTPLQPIRTRDLVNIEARRYAHRLRFAQDAPFPAPPDPRTVGKQWLADMARHPSHWADLAVYAAITLATRAIGTVRHRRGVGGRWHRDAGARLASGAL